MRNLKSFTGKAMRTYPGCILSKRPGTTFSKVLLSAYNQALLNYTPKWGFPLIKVLFPFKL